jgi:membrane protein DedA with SNARE-associated domain
MSPESLIVSYGYPLLFVGVMFEGETCLIIGAFLAHRGYLSLPMVMIVALLGTLLTDQAFFWLGKTKGGDFLARRPKWQSAAQKALRLTGRYQILLIISFRFLYGLRMVTPFVIGASGFPRKLFVPLNLFGAVIWVVVIGLAGYAFGHLMELILADLRKYELWIVLGLFVIGSAAGVYRWLKRRREQQPAEI